MMDVELTEAAKLFRENLHHINSGFMKLSLTTRFLNKFNELKENFFDNVSMTSSFQIASGNIRVEMVRDLQIISDIFLNTPTLKLLPDETNEIFLVNLSNFKNLKFLELNKVETVHVVGIQKIRSQLQTLVCCHSINTLRDILEKCGSDNSNGYIWSELREAAFTNNKLTSLDNSLEYALWLNTLDLSNNNIKEWDHISCLSSLKHLKMAYNRIEKVPYFNGSICNRLQTLILKNNFIEDIEGLCCLSNLFEIDLSENCLMDHRCLSALSHLASLQTLNLEGNPLSFHPQHRNRTCIYLHKNTATVCFVLDHMILKKNEKSLVGSLHPVIHRPLLQHSATNSSLTESINIGSDKSKKIRNVIIQEEEEEQQEAELEVPAVSPVPSPSVAHLETKRQIELLRQQHGTSWLNKESGKLVQDVLGLEKSPEFLSSTPMSDDDMYLYINENLSSSAEKDATADVAYLTANTTLVDAVEIAKDEEQVEVFVTESVTKKESDNESCYSEDENLDEGEECIYFASLENGEYEILLVVTETHISERNCTTSKQRARWHINTMLSCKCVDENYSRVQLDFDTVRRDRQQRIYNLEESEGKRLIASLREKMSRNTCKVTMYQCIKCSHKFPDKNFSIHCNTFTCPACKSNLIIESS